MASKKHRKKLKRQYNKKRCFKIVRGLENLKVVFIDDFSPALERTARQIELLKEIQEIFKRPENSKVYISLDSGGGSIH